MRLVLVHSSYTVCEDLRSQGCHFYCTSKTGERGIITDICTMYRAQPGEEAGSANGKGFQRYQGERACGASRWVIEVLSVNLSSWSLRNSGDEYLPTSVFRQILCKSREENSVYFCVWPSLEPCVNYTRGFVYYPLRNYCLASFLCLITGNLIIYFRLIEKGCCQELVSSRRICFLFISLYLSIFL